MLERVLHRNDPYVFPQPLDLDAYAAKYISAAEPATFSEDDLAPV